MPAVCLGLTLEPAVTVDPVCISLYGKRQCAGVCPVQACPKQLPVCACVLLCACVQCQGCDHDAALNVRLTLLRSCARVGGLLGVELNTRGLRQCASCITICERCLTLITMPPSCCMALCICLRYL